MKRIKNICKKIKSFVKKNVVSILLGFLVGIIFIQFFECLKEKRHDEFKDIKKVLDECDNIHYIYKSKHPGISIGTLQDAGDFGKDVLEFEENKNVTGVIFCTKNVEDSEIKGE